MAGPGNHFARGLRRFFFRILFAVALAASIVSTCGCHSLKSPSPLFQQDLHAFGFITATDGLSVNYTDLNFLSNDLLLVSANERTFGPVEPMFSDSPPSRLLLFDLSQKKLIRSVKLRIEKDSGSVRATRNGQFALLNQSGVRLCSADLVCGHAFATEGPLLVSPRGTTIVADGNAQSEEKVLDSSTLRETERFPWMNPSVSPGDNGMLLLESQGGVLLRAPGKPDEPITSLDVGAKFLNNDTIAGLEGSSVVVANLGGTVRYRIPVRFPYNNELVASRAGSRFCIHEYGYTLLNSLLYFYDIDQGRPFNFERVRVIDTDQGKQVFDLQWDPRPYFGYVTPALSPDGHKIAIVRHSNLEVFVIP